MFTECHINIVVTEKLRVNILWRWLKNLFTQKGRQNILTLLFKSRPFFEHPLLFGFWGFEQYLNSLQITKILTKHTKSRGSLNNRISSGPELCRIPKYKFKWHMTGSQYKGKYLSGRVTKNLTLCRISFIPWARWSAFQPCITLHGGSSCGPMTKYMYFGPKIGLGGSVSLRQTNRYGSLWGQMEIFYFGKPGKPGNPGKPVTHSF